MMRKILLLAPMLFASGLANATVVTQVGQFVSAGASVENGYVLRYSFAPIAIPTGSVISYQLDFVGFINPMVGGASGVDIATGNTITSVNVMPGASFASSLISGRNLSFPGNLMTSLPQTNEAYNNASNISFSAVSQRITLTGNSGSGVPADTFTMSNLAAVALFATPGTPFVIEPFGSRANFPGGANIDRSTGTGSLTLTVTYNPVPEPASMAILGIGVLGLTVLGRRASI